jgi:hypothetical protein
VGGGGGGGGLHLWCRVVVAQEVHAVENRWQRRLVRVLQQVDQRPGHAASRGVACVCRTSRASHLKNSLFFLSTISALKPPAPPPCISAVTAPDSSRLQTRRQRRRSLPRDTNPNHNPHATRHSTHLQIMTALSGSSPLASKLHSTLAYLPRDETHHTCARTWHGGDAQRVRRALALPLLQQHVSDVAQAQQLGERGVVHAAGEQQVAVTQLICDAARRVLRFLREVWGTAGGDARHGAAQHTAPCAAS